MAFEAGVLVVTLVTPKDLQVGLLLRSAKMYPEIDLCSDTSACESVFPSFGGKEVTRVHVVTVRITGSYGWTNPLLRELQWWV